MHHTQTYCPGQRRLPVSIRVTWPSSVSLKLAFKHSFAKPVKGSMYHAPNQDGTDIWRLYFTSQNIKSFGSFIFFLFLFLFYLLMTAYVHMLLYQSVKCSTNQYLIPWGVSRCEHNFRLYFNTKFFIQNSLNQKKQEKLNWFISVL